MANGRDGSALLGEYLRAHKLTREGFALSVNSTGASVSRWVTRCRVPRVAQAVRIERVTHGAVPVEAWGLVGRKAA